MKIMGKPMDITKAVRNMKNKKANGHGGISAEMIKNVIEKLYKMTTRLFNKCLVG